LKAKQVCRGNAEKYFLTQLAISYKLNQKILKKKKNPLKNPMRKPKKK